MTTQLSKHNPLGRSGWQQLLSANDYPDDSFVSAPVRERTLNPRTEKQTIKAIVETLDAQDVHSKDTPLHCRVQRLIRQRDDARRVMLDKVIENARLRAEIAALRAK